jgi:hypothetical protein
VSPACLCHWGRIRNASGPVADVPTMTTTQGHEIVFCEEEISDVDRLCF